MNTVRWVASLAALSVCLLAGIPPVAAQTPRRADPQVTRTSWGRVTGRVYDADTGQPVQGALVSVRHGGSFADSGRTAGKTDEFGQYSVQAPLGRVSENFDLGRALSSGLAGILLGGATNRTKRIDVTRLDLRVVASGLQTYSGPAACRTASADRFSVVMEPILLAREGSPHVSAVADGWGAARMMSAAVTPEVAPPGSEITIQASARLPLANPQRAVSVVCQSRALGKKRMTWVSTDGDVAKFEITLRAPKVRESVGDVVTVMFDQCPLDIAVGGATQQAVVQLVADPAERDLAERRAEAERNERRRDLMAALQSWRAVCEHPKATSDDCRRLSNVAGRLNEHTLAMSALERAITKAPERARPDVIGDYALALVRAGEAQRVISAYAPLVESRTGPARRQRTSIPLLVAVGQSYVATGALAEARRVLDELHEWPGPLPAEAIRFRASLRLAEANQRVRAESTPAARLHLARVLMDLGRWEEGLATAGRQDRTEAVLGSEETAFALRQVIPPSSGDVRDLDTAVREAESAAIVQDGNKMLKSKDFRTWHAYAMLLYRRATRAPDGGDRDADVRRSVEALEEAVRCGRAGAFVNEGVYAGPIGYASARLVAVTGFAYPEAAWDFVLMESLRTLSAAPTDEYALMNAASALVELMEYDSAHPLLERLAVIRPDDPEIAYLRAVAAYASGDRDAAMMHVDASLRRNPRHPRARLLLAQMQADVGNIADAAAAVAAHQAIYGALDTGALTTEVTP
ncbi:MAG: hypothetical protein GX446_03740 [Chthonomonadales bacterium]|nr:hypothetical protein [Chthonomonadales bacterium]